ncbi:MAG: glucosaminidase domain-containing protein [Gammaproteobacteria bacterium]|nr:glucosaminidase domain-containing protein [Gammaproteobacteria bacterium]
MSTTHHTVRWALVGFVTLGALLGTVAAQVYEDHPAQPARAAQMQTIRVENVTELQALFESHAYAWPLKPDAMPSLALEAFPPDFATLANIELKKSLFVRAMLPIVVAELDRVAYQRKLVDFLWRPDALTDIKDYRAVVSTIAQRYRVRGDLPSNQRGNLMWRLDSLPVAMVLAQAALESGWGTSKYALENNNLFGVYTPHGNSGRTIKQYASLRDSVRDYLSTVNTHPAYQDLRALRAGMRIQNQALDTNILVQGLVKYSERGEDYVDDVLRMLRGSLFMQIQRAEPTLTSAAI